MGFWDGLMENARYDRFRNRFHQMDDYELRSEMERNQYTHNSPEYSALHDEWAARNGFGGRARSGRSGLGPWKNR